MLWNSIPSRIQNLPWKPRPITGLVELGNTEPAQRVRVGRVGLNDMREATGPGLDYRSVLVDGEDLVAQPYQGIGDGTAEAAKAYDKNAAW